MAPFTVISPVAIQRWLSIMLGYKLPRTVNFARFGTKTCAPYRYNMPDLQVYLEYNESLKGFIEIPEIGSDYQKTYNARVSMSLYDEHERRTSGHVGILTVRFKDKSGRPDIQILVTELLNGQFLITAAKDKSTNSNPQRTIICINNIPLLAMTAYEMNMNKPTYIEYILAPPDDEEQKYATLSPKMFRDFVNDIVVPHYQDHLLCDGELFSEVSMVTSYLSSGVSTSITMTQLIDHDVECDGVYRFRDAVLRKDVVDFNTVNHETKTPAKETCEYEVILHPQISRDGMHIEVLMEFDRAFLETMTAHGRGIRRTKVKLD